MMRTGFIALPHLPLLSGVQTSMDPTHPAFKTSGFSGWEDSFRYKEDVTAQLGILQPAPLCAPQAVIWNVLVGPLEMYLRMKRPHMKSQLLYAPCKPPSYQIFKSLIFLSLPFSLRKRVRIHVLVIIYWDLPHTPQKQMSAIYHQLGSLFHAVWDKERSLESWHTWNGI